jgi:hypothetical protein
VANTLSHSSFQELTSNLIKWGTNSSQMRMSISGDDSLSATSAFEEESEEEDNDEIEVASIVMPDEFLLTGLSVFYSGNQLGRSSKATNIDRFKKLFGVKPFVCSTIWEDLQTHSNPGLDNRGTPLLPVVGRKLNPKHFLMALHHLKRYPTEMEREGPWDISKYKGREWVTFFLLRLQALKEEKITWPEDWGNDDLWVITVDGTHVWIEEPIHPDWSQDSKYFSHKHGKAGMNYELGIAISSSRLVWMNGPFKAGTNDITIFKDHGLKTKLIDCERMAIGDKGYTGHADTVSHFNRFDSRPVKKFKSRALKRHETFNNMTKRYRVLRGPFRHGVHSFATAFESVCVLCQYQLEYDEPLFDVLVEDVLREDQDGDEDDYEI